MGWLDFGRIEFNEDGDPILTPFWNEGPLRDKIEPIRRIVQPAIGRFLLDSVCDISRAMESAYRATGALSLASSMLAARTAAGCRGSSPGPTTVDPGSPPFIGGQCPVGYSVNYTVRDAGQVVSQSQVNGLWGPIRGTRISVVPGTSQGFAEILYSFQNGQPANTQLGGYFGNPQTMSVSISVERMDGQPDSCGSLPSEPSLPPPDGLPSPPNEGDVIYSPTWVDIAIDDRDSSQQWSLFVGGVVFGGVTGANVTVGDIPIRILPDWTVQVGDSDEGGEGGKPNLPAPSQEKYLERIAKEIDEFDNRLLPQLEEMERDLEAIPDSIESLFPELEVVSRLMDCEGNEIEFVSAGVGIQGLSNQLVKTTELIARGLLFACPSSDVVILGPLELLATGVVREPAEYIPVMMAEPYRRLTLVVGAGPNSRFYRTLGEGTTGYFGYWGHGPQLGDEPVVGEWRQVNTYRSSYELPGEPQWSAWLNLERGVEYSLYGQKQEDG